MIVLHGMRFKVGLLTADVDEETVLLRCRAWVGQKLEVFEWEEAERSSVDGEKQPKQ